MPASPTIFLLNLKVEGVPDTPVNFADPYGLWVIGIGIGAGAGSIVHPTGDSIHVGATTSRYLGTSRNNNGRLNL